MPRAAREKGLLRRLGCGASGQTLCFLVILACVLLCLPTLSGVQQWESGEAGLQQPPGLGPRGVPQDAAAGGPEAPRRGQPAQAELEAPAPLKDLKAAPPEAPSSPERRQAAEPEATPEAAAPTTAEPKWTFCAAQGDECSCPGRARWGNADTWREYEPDAATGRTVLRCSVGPLPDVIPGDADKHCECLGTAGSEPAEAVVPVVRVQLPTDPAQAKPAAPEWVFCASQWQQCICHGTVRWGNEGRWHEIEPKANQTKVTVSCSVAKLPDVAPGDDSKHCQCLGKVFVPGLPDEAAAETSEPLVSCKGHGWGGETAWEAQLREAMKPLCADAALRPYMEVYLDTRFREHYERVYGDDGWCEEAWVNFAAPRTKGKRVNGYAHDLKDQMVDSVSRYSSKPIIVVSFGPKVIPHLDPARYPRMVLLHARMKDGASFSFSALRAALLARVKVGVNIEEDMMFVSPEADTLFERTREEITEQYPFPMLPTHFLDRDPANKKHRYGNFLEFTVSGSPDPRFPYPTLRWGQAQATWTFWAFPFVGRWLAAKLLGREEQGVPTRTLGEAEDLLNVGLWREQASKAWCLWQMVGTDLVWNNYIGQRSPGPAGLNSDPSRFPKGVPIAFYWAWAEGSMNKYQRAFEELDKLKEAGGPPPKAYWHAGKFYRTFDELKNEHPYVACTL